MINLEIQPLESEAIKPFGKIMEWGETEAASPDKSQFSLIAKVISKGWYVGYLVLRNNSFSDIHRHPESPELFIPLKGTAILGLAELDSPDDLNLFALNKPLCLHKNIWHGEMCLKESAEVLIIENYAEPIHSEYYKLKGDISG